jgi:succinate-acetate transporter protein
MFLGSCKVGVVTLRIMFFTLALADFFAAIAFWTGSAQVTKTAGVFAVICAFFAFYTGFGTLLNPIYNKNVMPMGNPTPVKKAKAKELKAK